MKEQFTVLPKLPIVGTLKLGTYDGKSLSSIEVINNQKAHRLNAFYLHCYEELEKFLIGENRSIDLPLDLRELTPFQLKVLSEMKKIPYGETLRYKDIAERMNSKGYQAIGSACGRNPFLLIYPCHRVLGSKGIGGFAHGVKMKQELLLLEANALK